MACFAWFQSFYDLIREPILLIDKDGTILSVNNHTYRFLEIDKNDFINKKLETFILESNFENYLQRCYKKTRPSPGKFTFSFNGNTNIICRVYGARLDLSQLPITPLKELSENPFILLRLVKQEQTLAPYRLIQEKLDKKSSDIYKE